MRLVVSKFSTSSVSLRKFPEAEDKRDSRLSSNVFRVILKSFCCFVRSNFKQKKKNLKDRTNQYSLHQFSGHMKGVFWNGLTSFCLVADIKLLQSHLTLGVMRPVDLNKMGGRFDGELHTHLFWISFYEMPCLQLCTNAGITQCNNRVITSPNELEQSVF